MTRPVQRRPLLLGDRTRAQRDLEEALFVERGLAEAVATLPRPVLNALRAEQSGGWRSRAACRDADPDLWFPAGGDVAPEALRICASCPVSRACLASALLLAEPHGIWGGQPVLVRRALRKALEAGASAAAVLDVAEGTSGAAAS